MRQVVAVSGGKDSTALALRLAELNPGVEYDYIYTPVGNEPDELFKHIARLETILGKPIISIGPVYDDQNKVVSYTQSAGQSDGLVDIIRRQGVIPNFRMRFCTRQLKIEPTILWLQDHAPCIQYVGLRADEEMRQGIYGDIDGVEHRYPMRDEWGWGVREVWNYLEERGVQVPTRTDCAWCYHQRLVEWWQLWRQYPDRYDEAVEMEQEMGYTFRSRGRDVWPVGLAELREKFEAGHKPRGAGDVLQRRLFSCDKDALCRVCTL